MIHMLPETGGVRTHRGRPEDCHQMEQDGGKEQEGREVQRPDENDRHEPSTGNGRDPRGRPIMKFGTQEEKLFFKSLLEYKAV